MEWLVTNWNDFIIGIITGLLTTGLIAFGNKVYQDFMNRKSPFSGEWEQLIYEPNDNTYSGSVIKRDIYDLKHIRVKHINRIVVNISGKIRRHQPENQKNR